MTPTSGRSLWFSFDPLARQTLRSAASPSIRPCAAASAAQQSCRRVTLQVTPTSRSRLLDVAGQQRSL